MQDQKRGLNEAVSKELKAVDKKRLESLNKLLKTGVTKDKCIQFIILTLSRLINENEKATFADCSTFMSSVEEFHERVRKCDTSANSKEWLTGVMNEITGKDSEGGAIVKQLVNPLNTKMYIEFYPLFKLVSRMCYLGGAIRNIKL